ncbi:uncharacterized protein LOC129842404 [Salvelinus fontinalis]|uniref:uncharacterized protein LOC129842404 n=1 Tax=Salvelinus fontinalis TaxID=8038 RepID=UPI002484E6E5|nr:uncharacterized protein LOC129842404 [Salvelinus fontinalis]
MGPVPILYPPSVPYSLHLNGPVPILYPPSVPYSLHLNGPCSNSISSLRSLLPSPQWALFQFYILPPFLTPFTSMGPVPILYPPSVPYSLHLNGPCSNSISSLRSLLPSPQWALFQFYILPPFLTPFTSMGHVPILYPPSVPYSLHLNGPCSNSIILPRFLTPFTSMGPVPILLSSLRSLLPSPQWALFQFYILPPFLTLYPPSVPYSLHLNGPCSNSIILPPFLTPFSSMGPVPILYPPSVPYSLHLNGPCSNSISSLRSLLPSPQWALFQFYILPPFLTPFTSMGPVPILYPPSVPYSLHLNGPCSNSISSLRSLLPSPQWALFQFYILPPFLTPFTSMGPVPILYPPSVPYSLHLNGPCSNSISSLRSLLPSPQWALFQFYILPPFLTPFTSMGPVPILYPPSVPYSLHLNGPCSNSISSLRSLLPSPQWALFQFYILPPFLTPFTSMGLFQFYILPPFLTPFTSMGPVPILYPPSVPYSLHLNGPCSNSISSLRSLLPSPQWALFQFYILPPFLTPFTSMGPVPILYPPSVPYSLHLNGPCSNSISSLRSLLPSPQWALFQFYILPPFLTPFTSMGPVPILYRPSVPYSLHLNGPCSNSISSLRSLLPSPQWALFQFYILPPFLTPFTSMGPVPILYPPSVPYSLHLNGPCSNSISSLRSLLPSPQWALFQFYILPPFLTPFTSMGLFQFYIVPPFLTPFTSMGPVPILYPPSFPYSLHLNGPCSNSISSLRSLLPSPQWALFQFYILPPFLTPFTSMGPVPILYPPSFPYSLHLNGPCSNSISSLRSLLPSPQWALFQFYILPPFLTPFTLKHFHD